MQPSLWRPPTQTELAFLRIVTERFPELRAQIESCEVEEYDPTGYLDVRVLAGPPHTGEAMCDGPSFTGDAGAVRFTETILWIGEDGMLSSVEVVEYGDGSDRVFERFIDAARDGTLTYRSVPRRTAPDA